MTETNDNFDPWPEGYGQFDVQTVDGVTLLGQGNAVMFMTASDGLKVCMVIPLTDLVGSVRQLMAHLAPADIHQKNLIAINGGR